MNAIKALRNTTNMSQNKFASYLGIPVANIQHWEQGVSAPPNYLVSLISRVMKSDGYLHTDLSTEQIDMIRQTQATLAIENMTLTEHGLEQLQLLVKGSITREEYQKQLKDRYQNNASY